MLLSVWRNGSPMCIYQPIPSEATAVGTDKAIVDIYQIRARQGGILPDSIHDGSIIFTILLTAWQNGIRSIYQKVLGSTLL